MSSELIINSTRDKCRIGLLKDKKLVEFHQENDENKFNVGDIYVGKVKKINKSLNAAFIDIGYEKDAFLHYLDLGPQFLSLKTFVKKVRSKGSKTSISSFKKIDEINKFGKITAKAFPGRAAVLIKLLSLDENHIIGNYNKDVETYLKKHNVELIPFNFRHRYFWDGGIHCITQDLYREGTMEDYFG